MKPNMKLTSSTGIKTKAVKSRRIAWLLRKAGYPILSVEPNRMQPEYNVYIFKVTPGFQKALDKIIEDAINYQANKK